MKKTQYEGMNLRELISDSSRREKETSVRTGSHSVAGGKKSGGVTQCSRREEESGYTLNPLKLLKSVLGDSESSLSGSPSSSALSAFCRGTVTNKLNS